jgi:hypothetical protein
MSRYCFTHPENTELVVSFGFDHALGYFYDIADREDEVVEEKCTTFNRLTGIDLHSRLLSIMGSNTSLKERYSRHLDAMALDRSF